MKILPKPNWRRWSKAEFLRFMCAAVPPLLPPVSSSMIKLIHFCHLRHLRPFACCTISSCLVVFRIDMPYLELGENYYVHLSLCPRRMASHYFAVPIGWKLVGGIFQGFRQPKTVEALTNLRGRASSLRVQQPKSSNSSIIIVHQGWLKIDWTINEVIISGGAREIEIRSMTAMIMVMMLMEGVLMPVLMMSGWKGIIMGVIAIVEAKRVACRKMPMLNLKYVSVGQVWNMPIPSDRLRWLMSTQFFSVWSGTYVFHLVIFWTYSRESFKVVLHNEPTVFWFELKLKFWPYVSVKGYKL